jgi:tRNA(adenine34) deaminase
MNYEYFMKVALDEAEIAREEGEVPIGAVIVGRDEIIARAHNEVEKTNNQLKHAEMIAIENASNVLKDWRFNNLDIYVTIEPCLMCMGAILLHRFKRLIYGAPNKITGVFSGPYSIANLDSNKIKTIIISGILDEEALNLIKGFFDKLRS